jgi:polysaccharide biosynthesis protein PslG
LIITLLVATLSACAMSRPPVASAASVQPGFFGVDGSSITGTDFQRMADANIGSFRTVFPYTAVMKTTDNASDAFDWTPFDFYVGETAKAGIDMVPFAYGVPPWISTLNSTTPFVSKAAMKGWEVLLRSMVERYGPDGDFWADNPDIPYHPVEVWQVWNEPNSRTWWQPKPDPKAYGKLLVDSAKVIHSVDPTAQIMTAGIVAKPTNAAAILGNDFFKALFKSKAVRKQTDIVAFHPYAPTVTQVEKQLESARSTLNAAGMAKTPIWVTELGWGSKGPKDHPLIMTEAQQENALGGVLRMAADDRKRLGLGRFLWYHWQDTPDDPLCLWCQSSGLIEADGTAKPLLDIFSGIARF